MQAKYQDSIGLEDSHDLITSASAAFSNPFRHRTRGTDERIVSFFVANAGNVSTQAEANFFNAINGTPYAAHVRLLNGKTLLDLDRWATINRVEDVGAILSGLAIELASNASQISLIRRALNALIEAWKSGKPGAATVPANRLRLVAVEHYLQKPVLPTHISVDNANTYWFLGGNGVNGMLTTMAATFAPNANMIFMAERVLSHLETVEIYGNQLKATVVAAQGTLGPLATL